jgi:hypothetical protein
MTFANQMVYYGCPCGHTRKRKDGQPKTKCPNCKRLPYLNFPNNDPGKKSSV